ncbi:hypothetical protein BDP81DRAFT_483558 [Colletotrichum phormii]|uniref:Actin n=1 Tax=Colletotrichum phormii TaxID=359342 RepID=A0AAI9ZJK9_9PEZI|nr:uncharacterized protein BDP81DRAFT_483558 [Colletotrichum phormii]KAK1625706.1 hypothetical protein BDP81DRAFT_483558 [Colletotrichum phormii]
MYQSTYNVGHAVNPDYEGLSRPLYLIRACGVVTDWQDAARIRNYVLAELGASIPLSCHPIVMTEPLYVPHPQQTDDPRTKTAMMSEVFEYFPAPAFYTTVPAVLSTYAANLPTALVVDSGYAAIDDWLQQALMNEVGVELPSNEAWDIALWLAKTERCRVAMNFEEESMRWKKSMYDGRQDEVGELPDGLKMKPNTPLGGVSFKLSMLGLDFGGLQYDAFNIIMNCNRDIREEFCQNVLLAGGNTMFPGFGARLERELKGLFKEGTKINVISPRNRAYSAWVGGSMLSEFSTFEGMCVTRAEYEEAGPEIANN